MSESTYEYLLEQLDTIWNSYGEDKVGKGSAFERLMASYLRTAPEYADRFDEVYLWQDWPERGNQHDHGIDIVARDASTGGWCAVQCKFYDPQHHVAKQDIDSFLAASAKKAFTSRIIFSTAKDWGPTAERQLDGLTVPVVRIGINDLLESKVDWTQIDWQSPQQYLPTEGKHDLRPHQKKAKAAVLEGFETHDRGQLIMACGTGKTFTSLKIADAADLKKSLPRIPLVKDLTPFVKAGEKLMELHLGCETVTPYPLDGAVTEDEAADPNAFFAVGKKMRFGKPTTDQKAAGERHDRSVIRYNDRITLSGICSRRTTTCSGHARRSSESWTGTTSRATRRRGSSTTPTTGPARSRTRATSSTCSPGSSR